MDIIGVGRDYLISLAYKHNNIWDDVYWGIRTKEDTSDISVKEAIFNNGKSSDILTILDNEYPTDMKSQITKPPFVIYYKGDLSALQRTDYFYLVGDNRFDIPVADLIRYDKNDHWLNIGDRLLLKINNSSILNDAIRIGVFLSKAVVVTKKLSQTIASVTFACGTNKDVFVVPTIEPSKNNELINDGAILLDKKETLYDR